MIYLDNIIMDVYDSIKVILFKIFKTSLEEVVFPEKLKIAKVKKCTIDTSGTPCLF